MIFCTYTNFIQEYSNKLVVNGISFPKSLILHATTNISIITKLHQNISLIKSAASTIKTDL